ncbi:MAG: hypothetical protein KF869_08910 [Phycisphaeraceae bacterium]|nr:hypothetical protein [Phycisphaeraceae bacterium]
MRELTIQGADAVTLAKTAHAEGMRSMIDDAREKVSRGLTDEAEIRRVLD